MVVLQENAVARAFGFGMLMKGEYGPLLFEAVRQDAQVVYYLDHSHLALAGDPGKGGYVGGKKHGTCPTGRSTERMRTAKGSSCKVRRVAQGSEMRARSNRWRVANNRGSRAKDNMRWADLSDRDTFLILTCLKHITPRGCTTQICAHWSATTYEQSHSVSQLASTVSVPDDHLAERD